MQAGERARSEQLNTVPQPDKEQKPALLLPSIPKLLYSSVAWQDAVVLLPPWGSPLYTALAQPQSASASCRPLLGTRSPVWTSNSVTSAIAGCSWNTPALPSRQSRAFIQTDQTSSDLLVEKLGYNGKLWWGWRQGPHSLPRLMAIPTAFHCSSCRASPRRKGSKSSCASAWDPGYKQKSSPHEDSQALEKVAQEGCAVSIPGGF